MRRLCRLKITKIATLPFRNLKSISITLIINS